MSSLHILNRAVKTYKGGGLPFYEIEDYIFSNWNNDFNSDRGLWIVPPNKIPTFQLIIPQANLLSLEYRETRGGNDFTGTTYNPLANGATITVTGVQIDGNQFYIYESSDSDTLAPPPSESRWIMVLTVNDGVTEFEYFSEEFVTRDCCL